MPDARPDDPKEVVRRFYAAFAAEDLAALRDLLGPGFRAHHQGASQGSDVDQHLATVSAWHRAFSGTRFDIEDQIAEGELVATVVTMSAVHDRGAFGGREPSGRHIHVPAVTVERVREGRLVERRVMSDSMGMVQQLAGGADPA